MTSSTWRPIVRLIRLVLICAAALGSGPAVAQVGQEGGRREPPADGPWNRGSGSDPTDGRRQDEARRRQAQAYFDAGLKLLEKDQIPGAKTKFKSVVELVGREGVGQSAYAQLVAIHDRGAAELTRADELYREGKYQEALQVAKKTRVLYAAIFEGLRDVETKPNLARSAADLIDRINADPKAQEAIQEEAAARLFRRIPHLERAAQAEPRKNFDLYRALERIATRYPACPTGRASAERLHKLISDAKLRAIIEREQQRRVIAAALGKAAQYEKEGRPDLAAIELAKLRERHPGKSIDELRRLAK